MIPILSLRRLSLTLLFPFVFLRLGAESAVDPALAAFADEKFARFAEAEAALAAADAAGEAAARQALDQASVLTGPNGWLFTLNDLRHHAAGKFWGEAAADAAVSARHPDPLPAIAGFAAQAREAGVRLILLPVPSKIALYPEELHADLAGWEDPFRPAFLAALREAGVEVLDIAPALQALKAEGIHAHVPGDTHWSPAAVEKAADLLLAQLGEDRPVADDAATVVFTDQERQVRGDLAARVGGERDVLRYRRVTLNGEPARSDAGSPVVLMGDSHGLVFGHADLLTTGAGLGDHLAGRLGFPLDVIAAMGSGANASRITLARRGDNLSGKEVLIWVFAEREWSRSTSGWPPVPVVR